MGFREPAGAGGSAGHGDDYVQVRSVRQAHPEEWPLGTTNYLYDGKGSASNLLEELDQSGNVLARYVQKREMDEPLAESRSGMTIYYQQDSLGSTTSLSSSSSALTGTYAYDSFGNLSASTGTITNPIRFTGREFDPETGVYFYRARYFDPSTGRFVSEDPVGFIGGFNFYLYVNDDPNDSTDPTGLCPSPSPCNNVPAHPGEADVSNNMSQAESNGYWWWYRMVTAGHGPWDYKYYKGKAHPEYDDFGNFNYGATGCALGIPLNILLRGAGYAKSRLLPNDPYGNPLWRYPYGNQPDKQEQVIKGYEYCLQCSSPSQPGFSNMPFGGAPAL